MIKEKKALRREVRERLSSMSNEEKMIESKEVLALLEEHPLFQSAQTLLLFWSLPDEVFTHDFIGKWSKKKRILLPVVVGDEMEIRVFCGLDSMREGAFGILEPTSELWDDYEEIDLCVVPGVGFDSDGHRLGRGKGYYDKFLSRTSSYKLGICFGCQYVKNVPSEEWDILMDEIVTLKR